MIAGYLYTEARSSVGWKWPPMQGAGFRALAQSWLSAPRYSYKYEARLLCGTQRCEHLNYT